MFFKFAFYLVFEPQTIWCLTSTKKKSPTWCKNTFPFTKSHPFVLFYINPTWDCLFMCSCEPGYPLEVVHFSLPTSSELSLIIHEQEFRDSKQPKHWWPRGWTIVINYHFHWPGSGFLLGVYLNISLLYGKLHFILFLTPSDSLLDHVWTRWVCCPRYIESPMNHNVK